MIASDDTRIGGRAVAEAGANHLHVVDHMEIRDDIAARIDHDASSHAVHAVGRRLEAISLIGDRGRHGAFGVDIDDRILDFVDDFDERRAAQITGGDGEPGPCGKGDNQDKQTQAEKPGTPAKPSE